MIREKLRKLFPLSKSLEDRQRFVGWIGKQLDTPDRRYFATNERYLMIVASKVIFLSSLIAGGALYIFFAGPFYQWPVPVPSVNVPSIFDQKIFNDAGRAGLYVFYYTNIMEPAIWGIALLCFLLFLIHVKKGEIDPFKNETNPIYQNRNRKNLTLLFFRNTLGFGVGVFAANYLGENVLKALQFVPGLFEAVSRHRVFWIFPYGFIVIAQIGAAMMLYVSSMLCWSIVFRYDLPPKNGSSTI